MPTYTFSAELWQYPGYAAWYFVTLPKDIAKEINAITDGGIRRGFGSVKINAKTKTSTWNTSVFPDKESGSYLLPIKKAVRQADELQTGDTMQLEIRLQ